MNLRGGPSHRHRFANWPNAEVPAVAAGVYVAWEGDRLIYCGWSGREYEKAVAAWKRKYGVLTGLASHASGRLIGDQFFVYVADRLVIPSPVPMQWVKFGTGDLRLYSLTKTYISGGSW